MIDGIIKADGTSRLMRAELPATYEEFRAQCRDGTQTLDILFNALGWSQLPTFLNKKNLLKDPTASLFSLGADAVPDDVFGVLSRFHNGLGNEYVWEKYSDNIEYVVEKNAEVQYASYDKTSPVPFYKTLTLSDAHEIVLSDSFQIPARQDASGFSAAIGCYSNYDGKVYQLTRVESDSYANSLYGNPLTVKQVGGGFVEFVNSPYADAYPPAIDDGYTYTPLGQLGNKVQIATGSYTGTGTSGKDNRTSLTLDFVPKFIIVARNAMDTLEGGISVRQMDVMVLYPAVGGFSTYMLTSSLTNFYSVGSEVNGNTVLWWSKYDQPQMNASGKKYNYVAIG